MARSVTEWVGKSDDQPVPPRVRLRVLERQTGNCAGCGRSLVGQRWTCDHILALINGGENREKNLQPLGDKCCNPDKNKSDVGLKSESYHVRMFNAGIKRKSKSKPMLGSKSSGWKRTFNHGWVRR